MNPKRINKKLTGVVKKAPGAIFRILSVIVKQAKPDEIEISKNGSVIVRYKREF